MGIGGFFGRKRHQQSHLVWDFTLLAKQVLSQLSYTPIRRNQQLIIQLQLFLRRAEFRFSVHSVQ